jgi:DNA repair exonuclease SbcCD nuclease subunit
MSRQIRILHTSDLHLDAGFRAAGLPSARARERCAAHLEAFDRVVAAVQEQAADLLCIAGDLFEAAHTRAATVRHVARALGGCGRPVFVAPGNHDPCSARSVYDLAAWPPNVTIFRGSWTAVRLPELDVVVHGRGFTQPEESERLVDGLVVDGPGRHILVAHGSDESCRPDRHHPYRPFQPPELDAWPLLYAALGHYHRFIVLPAQRVRAVYCGSPTPQCFADTEEHGVVLARIDGASVHVELLPLPGRRFVTLRLDVSGADTQAELVQRLQAGVAAAQLQEDFLRLHLQGSLPPDLEVDVQALQEALRSLVHDVELRDETVPEYDLAAIAREATVRGQFVRTLSARLEAAGDGERDVVRRALYFGLDAFAGRLQAR